MFNPNITVNVTLTTPEAVAAFMAALSGAQVEETALVTPACALAPTAFPPAYPSAPVAAVPVTPVPPPAAAAPTPAPASVPTSAPEYTFDALAHAAAPLMDAGKTADLQALLRSFGVQALTQLPKEQYGSFATALRGLGARV